MKIFKYLLLLILAFVLSFFLISYLTEYKPDDVTPVGEYSGREDGGPAVLPDTLRLMSWNIGYAGLGDNMDFFMDGGERSKDTRERTEQNLTEIISLMKAEDADIYLIQEVDERARRTYRINEIEAIAEAFPGYYAYFAPNFDVWFVPSPVNDPMGRVCSGVMTLSRIKPTSVRRLQYPSSFSFPMRMFNLKRCLLEADFVTSDGRTVHIGNTHNTAFDAGGMRLAEDEFLKDRIASFAQAGEPFIVAGDWNQCPPQYTPSKEELDNEFFAPSVFDTTGINSFARVLCDTSHYSMRYNDKPYCDSSTKSILDFCIVPRAGLEVFDFRTIDLDFHSSDHNPVWTVVGRL